MKLTVDMFIEGTPVILIADIADSHSWIYTHTFLKGAIGVVRYAPVENKFITIENLFIGVKWETGEYASVKADKLRPYKPFREIIREAVNEV